jgi:hypothetical protein
VECKRRHSQGVPAAASVRLLSGSVVELQQLAHVFCFSCLGQVQVAASRNAVRFCVATLKFIWLVGCCSGVQCTHSQGVVLLPTLRLLSVCVEDIFLVVMTSRVLLTGWWHVQVVSAAPATSVPVSGLGGWVLWQQCLSCTLAGELPPSSNALNGKSWDQHSHCM